MLNSCLDIFEARMPSKTIGHDFGLLHALDERIAMYGWLTNTGVKLIVVVDMEGRPAISAEAGKTAILGLRNSDLTPVCIIHLGKVWSCANAGRRHFKRYKQLIFAFYETRSTCRMTMTRESSRARVRCTSPVRCSSKRSSALGTPGRLAYPLSRTPDPEQVCLCHQMARSDVRTPQI